MGPQWLLAFFFPSIGKKGGKWQGATRYDSINLYPFNIRMGTHSVLLNIECHDVLKMTQAHRCVIVKQAVQS